jgi:uncharacterized protein
MKEVLPWYIAGPLIGLIVPLLLILRSKQFGISSSYRYFGAMLFPKVHYFNYAKRFDRWQVHFAIGLVAAGVYFGFFSDGIVLFSGEANFYYEELAKPVYDLEYAQNFLLGGILLGFGARYANGCTAGHCIMGVSQLSIASIVATFAFFIGGLIVSVFLNPYLFK